MPLPSGLETAAYGTQGWNAIYSDDFQLLDTKLVNVMTATKILGQDPVSNNTAAVNNPAAQQSQLLTDSTGGTVSQTLSTVSGSGADAAINDNFASLTDEVNKLRADLAESRTREQEYKDAVVSLQSSFNTLLATLRKSGGNGVLA